MRATDLLFLSLQESLLQFLPANGPLLKQAHKPSWLWSRKEIYDHTQFNSNPAKRNELALTDHTDCHAGIHK